jgi:aspartate racemase
MDAPMSRAHGRARATRHDATRIILGIACQHKAAKPEHKMKVLGLLGGMSWESTIPYYRMINEQVKQQLGGLHSAKIVLYSVDFQEVERLQHQGDWDEAGRLLADAAVSLRAAGAEAIVICTNTMHKVADVIEEACGLPLVHIADATALQIMQQQIARIGLLGTRFTMEQDFYRGRLQDKFGIEVITPDESDREIVHRIIIPAA